MKNILLAIAITSMTFVNIKGMDEEEQPSWFWGNCTNLNLEQTQKEVVKLSRVIFKKNKASLKETLNSKPNMIDTYVCNNFQAAIKLIVFFEKTVQVQKKRNGESEVVMFKGSEEEQNKIVKDIFSKTFVGIKNIFNATGIEATEETTFDKGRFRYSLNWVIEKNNDEDIYEEKCIDAAINMRIALGKTSSPHLQSPN